MPASRTSGIALGLALFAAGMAPMAQTMGVPERFSAIAFDVNSGQTGRVEISIKRWSTAAEREDLLSTLFKEGPDELLQKLEKMRTVGRIYTPESVGYELRYAEQRALPDGGRTIVAAAARRLTFYELLNRPRSADYPFTWIQINMPKEGNGEGVLAVAARVYGDSPNRPIEVENYKLEPLRLQSVTARTED